MTKIGIVIKESSKNSLKKYDLQQFLIYEKFAFDIIIELSKNQNISVQMIKKSVLENIIPTVEKDSINLLIALGCTDEESNNGIRVIYNSSFKAERIAKLFQKSLVESTQLKDLNILSKGADSDRIGRVLDLLQIPCVIADPFPVSDGQEMQTLIKNYSVILKSYIATILNSLALI
jgi:hypothetical protein